ncbi:anti-virulence regulator CigR family protein [Zobellella maritima]|uniref:anti-virulence regulator CigR family protein n=1 Tax=Zobellella maritima TaxID=2059725 RepID=UPI001E50ABEB|nr:anti-virulence regulator CigR family protein [Zobellella maritima]
MANFNTGRTSLLGCAMGLLLAAAPVLAEPPEGKGHGAHKEFKQAHGKARHHEDNDHQGNGQDNGRAREHRRYREDQQGNDRDRAHRRDNHRDGHHGPSIDEARVRLIFRDYHRQVDHHHHDYEALPPGIRMNLKRGKPLPPGIAKQFDPHLYSRLPHYDGYEWHRVGRDAVLVEIATRNIHLILEHILD